MATKKPIESKVLWFNFLSILAIVITEMLATPEIKEALGSYAMYIMVAGAFVNGALRKYTTKPLEPILTQNKNAPQLDIIDEALRKEAEEEGLV
ncbi:MAG: hypothetical protein KAI79_16895 [Bacteroidales bacterium]|nr:hypothetical protein [Bacteroidales bacterium]